MSILLAAMGVGLIGMGLASPATTVAGAAGTSGAVSGIVFRDYNGNGAKDALEPGQEGIEIRAFDTAGAPVGALVKSVADGSYNLAVAAGDSTAVRVEFGIPSAYTFLQSGPVGDGQGTSSGTSVQFTTVGAKANFGVWNPTEYCQANPTLVLACHTFGDAVKGTSSVNGALKTFPADAKGSPFDKTNSTTATNIVKNRDLGTTFGLAYNRTSKDIYASAFHRVYAGYGPSGSGAIYKVATDGTPTLLATIPNAGDNSRAAFAPNTTGPNADWLNDPTWDKVGKTSLGGLVLSDDETTVWVVNLNDRSLYPVNVADGAVGPPVAIPLATGGTITCDPKDVRPMALASHDGKLYVGETCSAESTKVAGNLAMSIYSFDPVAKTFAAAPVFESKFDATHGRAGNGCGPNGGSGAWNAWTPTDVFNSTTNRQCSYPQPWLTGIAFDRGNLVLGIRDRFGDQAGEDHPVGGEGVSAGDLLRACGSLSAGWKLESNGSCGGAAGSGVGNTQGPGGGEFYRNDNFFTAHQEVSLGSIVQLPGTPNVIYTVFDPSRTNGNDWRAGGVHTDANANGAAAGWFEVFDKCDSSGMSCPAGRAATGTFGKANSLGELEAMCDKAPIEIGNRVWLDTNSNGVQDANEGGIGGVTVSLFEGATSVGTTKTAADGTYVFNASDVAGGVKMMTDYTIRLNHALDAAAGGPLNGISLTDAKIGANRGIDSDSVYIGAVPTITYTTGRAGMNDHTLDFGFRSTYALGNRVFRDTDNSGTLTAADGAKPGIGNVTVELFRSGVVDPIGSTKTDTNGYYCFNNLGAGQYVASVAASNFTGPLVGLTSSTGAGQEADPNLDVDNNDNGIDGAGAISSGVIVLGGDEPLAEVDGKDACVGMPDNRNNLSIDFGFYGAAALGNYVWIDSNHDGLQNEPAANGVNGVTVTVTDGTGKVVGTALTANNPDGGAPGYYHVTNLAPGTYKVTFTTLPAGFAPTVTAAGADRALDSDSAMTAPVTLATGDDNLTLDLGLFAPTAVGDFTWLDANKNGVYDSGEAPLAGVTVTLLDKAGQPVTTDADGKPIAPQVTGTDGRYLFGNLRPGTYQVQFVAPAGYEATQGMQGEDPAVDSDGPLAISANLAAGQQDLTLDAGYVPLLVSLGDRVWLDVNENGVQDAGEKGVAGVVVNLLDCDGALLDTTTTDTAGSYGFAELLPGCYVVQFVSPATMQFTKPGVESLATDSNADVNTGRTTAVTLIGGQVDPTIDAGVFPKPAVKPGTSPTTVPAFTAVNANKLPRTGSGTYRTVVAAGLLAEIGALFLFIDSRRKKLI
jgi:SdrD B-like domain